MTDTPVLSLVDTDPAPRLRLVVMRIARLLRQYADPQNDLSTSLVSALATVERVGAVTLGELAAAERVQPPSMTRILAKLEAQGLVVRQVDPTDRRVARVEITPEGHRLLHRSRTLKTAFLAQRLSMLSPQDMAAVEAALPVLEKLAGELR